jgi:hypothetical protein
LKIVAEASYGLVLGIADIYIDDVASLDQEIRNEYRCVVFNCPEFNESGELVSTSKAILGKVYLSIESSPIAPLL